MANHVAATPSLSSPVPNIIITEPSPMVRLPSTMTLASSPDKPLDVFEEMDEEAICQGFSPMTADEIAEQLANDSLEYSPVQDCNGFKVLPAGIVEESRIDLAPEREEDAVDAVYRDLTSTPFCCQRFGGFRGFYYALSASTESCKSIPFWILLMCMPIASGFMGARYFNECPFSPAIPALLFMMGITGIIMLTTRIMVMIQNALCEEPILQPCLNSVGVITYIVTIVLFATESMAFWRYSPSFDANSTQYCNPELYEFTYWINCVTIVVWFLIFVIRIPVCVLPSATGE